MAEPQLVLCNALCFLVNKFGKNQVKVLKTALLDFYAAEDLSKAKVQLMEDLEKVKSTTFPHVPLHRQGDSRAVRDVDDMFQLLATLDENVPNMLSALPTYVADGPDNMPSTRVYEGDLGVLTSLLDKMNSKIGMLSSAVSNVARDVHNIQVKVDAIPESSAVQSVYPYRPWKSRSAEGDVNNALNQVCGQSLQQTVTTEKTLAHQKTGTTADSVVINKPHSRTENALPVGTWASLVSTPTHDNRFCVLGTTDDDESDAGPFIEPREARVKRRRELSAQQRQQQSQAAGGSRIPQGQPVRRSTVPLMVGKSAAVKTSITAANKIIKKSVFCIDNLSMNYTVNDIRSFITTTMGINVISCFDTKPRRRRNELSPVVTRKAFRVCVCAEDRERFLDESKWPDSVMIYDWFFRPPQPPADKRLRLTGDELITDGSLSSLPVTAARGRHLTVDADVESMEHINDDDNEKTIPLDSTLVNTDVRTQNDGDDY